MSAGVWVARSAGPSNAVAGRPDDARAALAEGLGATPAFPATFERWLADGILPERPSIAPGVVIKSPGAALGRSPCWGRGGCGGRTRGQTSRRCNARGDPLTVAASRATRRPRRAAESSPGSLRDAVVGREECLDEGQEALGLLEMRAVARAREKLPVRVG